MDLSIQVSYLKSLSHKKRSQTTFEQQLSLIVFFEKVHSAVFFFSFYHLFQVIKTIFRLNYF